MKVIGFVFNVGIFDVLTDLLCVQLLLVTVFPCKHRSCALLPKITKKRAVMRPHAGTLTMVSPSTLPNIAGRTRLVSP